MQRLQLPAQRILDEEGKLIRCPRCGAGYHHSRAAGNTEPGIDPRNLELECGRCGLIFYEFFKANNGD